MSDETPRWMLYEGDEINDLSGKQCALIDAIDVCAWSTPGPLALMTTEDAARIVGCDVESAWHALRAVGEDTEIVSCHPPEDFELASRYRSADLDDWTPDMQTAAKVLWSAMEDEWSDDDEYYAARIAASKRLGRDDAVLYWEAARDERLRGGSDR